MTARNHFSIRILTLLFVLAVPIASFASNAGKIAGVVVDSEGQPIPSANVVLLDTQAGGAADLDGRYFIIGVPPGSYDLQFTALGYRTKIITDVQVRSNYTVRVNVTLEAESVELTPVTVVYKKPPVDLEETGQRISVSGDFVRSMPIQGADDILPFQAGASSDAEGNLHIRGGRSGEVGYIVDGMRVENSLYGDGTTDIDRHSLQELQLLSGTFNAEYGQAMSGIVQVITREGDDRYRVNLNYESSRLNDSRYRERDWVNAGSDAVHNPNTGKSAYNSTDVSETNDLWLSMPGRLGMTLSGPVPAVSRTTFFVNGVHEAENSYLPFGDTWLRQISGKLTNSHDFGKLALSFGLRKNNSQAYSHAWKYFPEQYHRKFDTNSRISATYSANLTNALFLEVMSGYNRLDRDRKIFEDWEDYLSSDYSPADFTYSQYFYDENDWSDVWR
ncbi:MAG TPA: hypothetical protein ENH10_02050, partial [Bacteroidetes bacterium]|nr:hypothetical protein [Bacteroidota bacterium]HEX03923.1 hypothetical protein [Bacteroidota bacterium]